MNDRIVEARIASRVLRLVMSKGHTIADASVAPILDGFIYRVDEYTTQSTFIVNLETKHVQVSQVHRNR